MARFYLLVLITIFSIGCSTAREESLALPPSQPWAPSFTNKMPGFPIAEAVTKDVAHDYWDAFFALTYPYNCSADGCSAGDSYFSDGGTAQFMTWEQVTDLFPPFGETPQPWDQQNTSLKCKDGGRVMTMFAKTGTFLDEVEESGLKSGPLPDATGRLTHFDISYNKVFYDYVQSNGLHDRTKWFASPFGDSSFAQCENLTSLPDQVNLFPACGFDVDQAYQKTLIAKKPLSKSDKAIESQCYVNGQRQTEPAIMLKTAWRNLKDVDEKFHKYFLTEDVSIVTDESTCTDRGSYHECDCENVKVGLVGLHIVAKSRPGWAWGTFEHLCNLDGEGCPVEGLTNYKTAAGGEGFSYIPRHFKSTCNQNSDCLNGSTCTTGKCQPATCTSDSDCQKIDPNSICHTQEKKCFAEPVAISRVNPVSSSQNNNVVAINKTALTAIKKKHPSGVLDWRRFYRLVGVEWGQGPGALLGGTSNCNTKASPGGTMSNITMETYVQKQNCFACHLTAFNLGADYSFSMAIRAKPALSSVPVPVENSLLLK